MSENHWWQFIAKQFFPDVMLGSCLEKASTTGKPQRKGIIIAMQSNG